MAEEVRRRAGVRRFLPRGYALVLTVTVVVILALFAVAQALQLPVLTDPSPWLDRDGPVAALVGVGLLVADVAIPTPSSVIMVAHGALFGVVGGALLSLLGATSATLLAFWLGRRSRGLVTDQVSAAEQGRMAWLVERYGTVAIVATRPVPIAAEAVAVLAGTTPMRWRGVAVGAVLGNLAPALVYAYAGSRAATIADQAIILGVVLALSFVLFLVGRRLAGRGRSGRG